MIDQKIVTQGAQVTLHFSLALRDGKVIDSNFDVDPASFTMGDGNLLPGFEEPLLGLRPGVEVEVTLAPEKAFGLLNLENIHRIPKSKFNLFLDEEYDSLAIGTVVAFKDPAGFDLPGVVKEKTEFDVTVDFNHPLADKEIIFRARIIDVLPNDTAALELKV
jgi:FKBP-type peptidyl-prolyl cis-trans isomerase SlpA